MKTVEEWMPAKRVCEVTPEWIQEIQLDAMKEGMRKAAAEANKRDWEWVDFNCAKGINDAILSAAEQLTEKDL